MSQLSSAAANRRQSTGNPAFDELLGGGLFPGTLTVVVGATGAGKTQLGLQFAQAGQQQEGRSGVIFDVSARGDSQSHADYAQRMFSWGLEAGDADRNLKVADLFERAGVLEENDTSKPRSLGDYLHVFDRRGQRVTRRDMDDDSWREWQAELNAKLRAAIAFLYGNFVGGVRRVVVDGVEPTESPLDSVQFDLFEYVYHQIIRKDPLWVARDLFREKYRSLASLAEKHQYPVEQLGCLLLCTSRETMLDDLVSRGIDEGDVLSNANTVIYMGRVREGRTISRALYIAKHRGSACAEQITPYAINDHGVYVIG